MADRFHAGTTMVDVGGYRLALTCQGAGTPTVVLETGLSMESHEWEAVQRQVARFTHVCWYDRAGRGQSDPAPKPRSARQMVADLHALLHAAEVPGPYVLAGTSLGGIITRLYAATYPEEVVGLVLVDASHADQFELLGNLLPPTTENRSFYHFWAEGGWKDPACNAEGVDFPASCAQAREVTSLGDIPIAILTSESWLWEIPVGDDAPAQQRLQELWCDLHRSFLSLSPRAWHTIVSGSRHCIQCDDPEAVVEAIRRVVEEGSPAIEACD
jgi:pimeloyl-ACP methyl ester carboxylesterase